MYRFELDLPYIPSKKNWSQLDHIARLDSHMNKASFGGPLEKILKRFRCMTISVMPFSYKN